MSSPDPGYNVLFIIKNDAPLFQTDLSQSLPGGNPPRESPHLSEFIAHASLDELAGAAAANGGSTGLLGAGSALYLKEIDKFSEFLVSAYTTHAKVLFLLLHKHRNEEAVKNFFWDLHETWAKQLVMNPFYRPWEALEGGLRNHFEARVQLLGRRWFGRGGG